MWKELPKGPSPHLREASPEAGDRMEEFIEPRNIIRLQKPPGALPMLHHALAPAAHDPRTGF